MYSKIKSFKEFINEFEIEGELQSKPIWNGKDYLNSNGNLVLSKMNLTELPCIFPEVWDRGFYCNDNQLTSLKGAPKEVKGTFSCRDNKLISLEGAPTYIGGSFDCEGNPTKFLKKDVQRVSEVEGNIYV